MRSKAAAAALAATTVVVLTAGCGSSASNGSPTAAAGTGTSGTSGTTATPAKPGSARTSGANAGDGTLTIPSDAAADVKKTYQLENAVAICMRGKGFAYQAWIPGAPTANSPLNDEADYDASKAVLAKYGYGAYAQYVYPNDPNVPGHSEMPQNPNSATRNALDAAQQQLWDKTLQGDASVNKQKAAKFDANSCLGQAMAKIYPAKDQPDQAAASSAAKADAARSTQDRQNLNGDPTLVTLAQSYANCLRGKGITVSSTQVTDIRNALRFQYFGEAARRAHDAPGGHLDVATATPLLTAEIQASLADLDCGRDFRAAYLPKLKQFPDAEGVG